MYATVNGTRLYFDVEGAEYEVREGNLVKKPVCFVLHGGPGGNHIGFKPTFQALTDTMQLIYVDQRGCGFSDDAPEETLHIDYNVEDLEALREHLGLDRVWILGHSYGDGCSRVCTEVWSAFIRITTRHDSAESSFS